jgi:RES domain
MDTLFGHLTLYDVHADAIRNIVSVHSSQDLFDDLSTDPDEWLMAQRIEDEVKPPPYQSRAPIVDRPFEDARWFNAIDWPFKHWQASRYSDGSFGVWYGCDTAETSVHETVCHWYCGLLSDAGFEHEAVVGHRKLYRVAVDAALLDLRPLAANNPRLLDQSSYTYTQAIGARLHREGHPGLLTPSARRAKGQNFVVLNPAVLSNPRDLRGKKAG